MATNSASDRVGDLAVEKCAAQHFGPWMIETQWFTQAVSAVKAGTYKAAAADVVRDAAGSGERLYTNTNGVAVISIAGQITKGDSSFGGASSVRTRNAVRKAVADDRVSSILLQIDSPGGTVAGTGDLAGDVAAANKRKPVYTYYEDLGASAALWIGLQARRVFANPTALIGSIGTVAVVEDSSGAMEKAGIKVHVISTGPYKGAFTDGAPVTDDQLADLQREVESLNEHFLAGVSAGRKMPLEQVRKLATGQCWIAAEAKTLGLIDEVASFDATMQAITKEVTRMNAEQFSAYAAENPESAEVKAIVAKGYKAGTADAHAAEVDRLKAIVAACPGKQQLAIDQFVAGHDADSAKATAAAIDAALTDSSAKLAEANARAEAALKEVEKVKALAGSVTPVAGAASQPAAGEKPARPDGSDHKALAGWEWDNEPEKRGSFSSKERYVGFRAAVLSGRLRVNTPASAAPATATK
jgi:signal peptide peptidase SppA